MKKQVYFAAIALIPHVSICQELEENDVEIEQNAAVDLFQSSLDTIQQFFHNNTDVIEDVKKFLIATLRDKKDFKINDYLDSYTCLNQFSFVSFTELQKLQQNFEIVECYLDFGAINKSKEKRLIKSNKIFFFLKSLIYESFSHNYSPNLNSITANIIDAKSFSKIFLTGKNKQRLNKFIKETFKIRKNIDLSRFLHFVVLKYKKNFSVESLELLCSKYSLFTEGDKVDVLISSLRQYDINYNDLQNTIDVIAQNVSNDPSLIKIFLYALIDKPLFLTLKASETKQKISALVEQHRA